MAHAHQCSKCRGFLYGTDRGTRLNGGVLCRACIALPAIQLQLKMRGVRA